MNTSITFQEIAAEIQLFDNIEQKEQFIFVVGALVSRIISLHKAAEIMEMDTEMFLKILELMGIDFFYLTTEDIDREKNGNLYENCFQFFPFNLFVSVRIFRKIPRF